MTGNQMFCRENELDESFKQLASYINIPVGVLLPFKSHCFVRHYNKGQIVYYSSDETTHIYLLLKGNIMRENFNLNGDVYRYLNREKVLFPLNNLFQDKVPNEMCTALTDCEMIGIPRDLIEYLCKNHEEIFVKLFSLLSETQCQHIEYNMALTSKLAKERVTKILRYLCQTVGYDHDEFYEIKHFMTIQLLSDMAGISRETTSHIINELREEKILFKNSKNWLVSKDL